MLFQIIKYSLNTNVRGNTCSESNSGKTRNTRNVSNTSDACYASNATMQLMHLIQVMDNDNQ